MFNCYLYRLEEPAPRLRRPEKLLYLNWLNQNFPQNNLKTTKGVALSIISPGKRNELEGPDFKDAMILLGGEICKGDIEIHWKSSDWYAHGHSQDDLYDNVILHVVANHDTSDIRTKSGKILPTFVLTQLVEIPRSEPPCITWPEIAETKVQDVIQNLNRLRWQRKSQNWQNAIECNGAEEAFYQGWADVLGFSQNRQAFRQFARILPLEKIYYLLSSIERDPIPLLEAVFFGTVGFLDDKLPPNLNRDSLYFQTLVKDWHWLQSEYGLRRAQDLPWHFAGTRPANYPHKRLAALAQCLVKLFPAYPGQTFISQIKLAPNYQRFYEWAVDLLQQPEGLWKNHPLFIHQRSQVLMGTERLNDFLTNLVLPYCRAIATLEKDSALMEKAILFSEQVALGEIPQTIRTFYTRLKIDLASTKCNWMVQGAIEFNQRFCELNLCNLCPLEAYVTHK